MTVAVYVCMYEIFSANFSKLFRITLITAVVLKIYTPIHVIHA